MIYLLMQTCESKKPLNYLNLKKILIRNKDIRNLKPVFVFNIVFSHCASKNLGITVTSCIINLYTFCLKKLEKIFCCWFLAMFFCVYRKQRVLVSYEFCEIIHNRFFIHKHLLLIVLDYFLFRQYVLPFLPYTFPNGLPTWIYGKQNHFSIVYQLFLSHSLVKRMDIWFFCNILFCLPN